MFFNIKISNSLGNTGFTTPAHLNMARNSKIEEQIYLSTAGKGLMLFYQASGIQIKVLTATGKTRTRRIEAGYLLCFLFSLLLVPKKSLTFCYKCFWYKCS